MLRLKSAACLFALAIGVAVGCGGSDGPDLVEAGGTVTYQGAPLAGATVTFVPEKGPIATGTTDLDGKFTLSTAGQPGVVAGTCNVAVTAPSGDSSGEDASPDFGMAKPGSEAEFEQQQQQMVEMMRSAGEGQAGSASGGGKSIIPEKFGNAKTSGLSFTVKQGDANQFTIEL